MLSTKVLRCRHLWNPTKKPKVRLDIRPGDLCLVFFCDVNTDGWEGGNGGNGAARHHDLADGFAIVGFHTQNRLE